MSVDYRLQFETCYGTLDVDGIPLMSPAWTIETLAEMYGTPDVRGDDRLLPGVAGVIPFRRRYTVMRYSLPFIVVGNVDQDGVPFDDPQVGLVTNLRYLAANVWAPTNVGNGTRTVTWHVPDGTTVEVAAHVLGFPSPDLKPYGVAIGTLELSVPGGDLHL